MYQLVASRVVYLYIVWATDFELCIVGLRNSFTRCYKKKAERPLFILSHQGGGERWSQRGIKELGRVGRNVGSDHTYYIKPVVILSTFDVCNGNIRYLLHVEVGHKQKKYSLIRSDTLKFFTASNVTTRI